MTEVTETPAAAAPEVVDAAAVKEVANGDAAPEEVAEEVAAVNGEAEEEAPKADEKEEAAAEPPVKKAKKSLKASTPGRRSSSRLVNVGTGTVLSKEISSDNLPKGKGTR